MSNSKLKGHRLRTIVCLLFVGLSVISFLLSLKEIGFYTTSLKGPYQEAQGATLLQWGWVGLLDGIVAWIANPLILLAWITIWSDQHRGKAQVLSLLAMLLAISFAFHTHIMTDDAGSRYPITRYGSGYWLWMGSMIIMVIGSTIVRWLDLYSSSPIEMESAGESGKQLP